MWKVQCSIVKGEEFIFNQINGTYQANYCLDDKTKILIFDKNKCNDCHCVIYGKNDTQVLLKMGCDFGDNIAHCFSYSGYEEWRNFENKEDDFKNCVKLKFDWMFYAVWQVCHSLYRIILVWKILFKILCYANSRKGEFFLLTFFGQKNIDNCFILW